MPTYNYSSATIRITSGHAYNYSQSVSITTGGTCCDDTTQPWFYRQLSQATQNDIEVQICAYGGFSQRSPLFDQLDSGVVHSIASIPIV